MASDTPTATHPVVDPTPITVSTPTLAEYADLEQVAQEVRTDSEHIQRARLGLSKQERYDKAIREQGARAEDLIARWHEVAGNASRIDQALAILGLRDAVVAILRFCKGFDMRLAALEPTPAPVEATPPAEDTAAVVEPGT